METLLQLLGAARVGDVLHEVGSLAIDDVLAAERGELEIIVRGPPRRILAVSAAGFASGAEQGTVLTLRDVTDERERETKAAHEERLDPARPRWPAASRTTSTTSSTVIISSTEFAMRARARTRQLGAAT